MGRAITVVVFVHIWGDAEFLPEPQQQRRRPFRAEAEKDFSSLPSRPRFFFLLKKRGRREKTGGREAERDGSPNGPFGDGAFLEEEEEEEKGFFLNSSRAL